MLKQMPLFENTIYYSDHGTDILNNHMLCLLEIYDACSVLNKTIPEELRPHICPIK